ALWHRLLARREVESSCSARSARPSRHLFGGKLSQDKNALLREMASHLATPFVKTGLQRQFLWSSGNKFQGKSGRSQHSDRSWKPRVVRGWLDGILLSDTAP